MIYAFLCDDEPFYSESVPQLKHWGILSDDTRDRNNAIYVL